MRPWYGRAGQPPEYQVAGAAHEGLRRPDVEPVRRLVIPHDQRAGLDEPGERLPLHRHPAPGRNPVDHLTAEDVAAGVDQVGHRLGRLLQERGHPAVLVGRHHAEPGRVRHLDQVQRHRGVGLDVQVDLCGQVVPGQDVGVQHHHGVGRAAAAQGPGRVADAARGVQRLLLLHVVDRQPEVPAVPEHRGEHLRLVAGGQDHVGDATRRRPGQQVGQERHARGGQQGLGRGQGQRSQPGALAPDEDNRL